jgi:hypothetical protein
VLRGGGCALWDRKEKKVNYMELTLYGNKQTYLIDYKHPSARGKTRESVWVPRIFELADV